MGEVLTVLIAAAIGAVPGLLALRQNRVEQERRRREARIPAELRPLLTDIIATAQQVADKPRNNAWVAEHVNPLLERHKALAGVYEATDLKLFSTYSLMGAQLGSTYVFAHDPARSQSMDQVADRVRKQQEGAEGAVKSATLLLKKLSAGEL